MKIFVGNMGNEGHITADDLRPLFENYGTVQSCEVVKNYAFVHMDDEESGLEAVRKLNGYTVKNQAIKVERSEAKGPRKPSQKLFIGNITEGTTSDELKKVFEPLATVIEADVIKNYGFVHIDANIGRSKTQDIIREMNGYNLNGSAIRVQLSTSGVRQKPGMGGDQCYRCGQGGHWSKECPQYPDGPQRSGGGPMSSSYGGRNSSGGYGGGMNNGRGGPMRQSPAYGSRGSSGGYSSNPYPTPPPPSYMRERMSGGADRGNDMGGGYGSSGYSSGSGYGSGGGGYNSYNLRTIETRGDSYNRPPADTMSYDRRSAYPSSGPSRDDGMRGPDMYSGGGRQDNSDGFGSGYSQAAYSTGAGTTYATGYGTSSAAADMFSRRSPGPQGHLGSSRTGYGPRGGGGYSSGMGSSSYGGGLISTR